MIDLEIENIRNRLFNLLSETVIKYPDDNSYALLLASASMMLYKIDLFQTGDVNAPNYLDLKSSCFELLNINQH